MEYFLTHFNSISCQVYQVYQVYLSDMTVIQTDKDVF